MHLIWKKSLKLTLLLSACLSLEPAFCQATAPKWQQSIMPAVELGVRDKWGALGSYTAVFVVTTPDGLEFKASREVKGDEWGLVYFPANFGIEAKPGHYKWQCNVNKKTALTGSFDYKSINGWANQLRVSQD
jgi:hypothetical protein